MRIPNRCEIDSPAVAIYGRQNSMESSAREQRLARIRTQRLAELGALLAGFAHEVRNPLSTIGLNLQWVQ